MSVKTDLPIAFDEEEYLGVKTDSSIQFDLSGRLNSENKDEIRSFARSQTNLYVGHKQVDDLYELKADGYILVVDSSGERDRVHLRTTNGNFGPVGQFGSLLIAAFAFIMTAKSPVDWRSFGIPLLLLTLAAAWYYFSQKYFRGTVRKQEKKMLEMIHKIDEVLTIEKLKTEN